MLRKRKKKPASGAGTDEVELAESINNSDRLRKMDLLMAGLDDLSTVRSTLSSVASRPKSYSNDIASPSMFPNSEVSAIEPGNFERRSKYDTNEKFLKSFNELKDVFIQRPAATATVASCSCSKYEEQTRLFCQYLCKLLDGLDEDIRDDTQLEILSLVKTKKKN